MKKFIPTILALLICILPVVGCNCDGSDENFARTPEEEYVRIRSLASDGVAFDFDDLTSFSATSVATLSGGKLPESYNMTSVYEYSRAGGKPLSYSKAKYVNAIFEQEGVYTVEFNEMETGFQDYEDPLNATNNGRFYLESMRTHDGIWSTPNVHGNGSYDDLLTSAAHAKTADRLVRKGARLLDEKDLENFTGGISGGYYYIDGTVKQESLNDFVEWLDAFLPLMRLKSEVSGDWKFFDMQSSATRSAKISVKTSARALEEVRISFTCPSKAGADFGTFEFSASVVFKSGGVGVTRLSYYA